MLAAQLTNLFAQLAAELNRLSGVGPAPQPPNLSSSGYPPTEVPTRLKSEDQNEHPQTSASSHHRAKEWLIFGMSICLVSL
jgi:hypothetical protein